MALLAEFSLPFFERVVADRKLFSGMFFTSKKNFGTICLNGGVPSKNSSYCICPDPHISGQRCETIWCENGGEDNGLGYCTCPDQTLSSKFCENASNNDLKSKLVMLSVPLATFAILIIFCVLSHFSHQCRSSRNRFNSQIRNSTRAQESTVENGNGTEAEQEILMRYNDLPPEYSPPPTYHRAIRTYISVSLGNVLTASRFGRKGSLAESDDLDIEMDLTRKTSRPQRLFYSKSHRAHQLFVTGNWRPRARSV